MLTGSQSSPHVAVTGGCRWVGSPRVLGGSIPGEVAVRARDPERRKAFCYLPEASMYDQLNVHVCAVPSISQQSINIDSLIPGEAPNTNPLTPRLIFCL